MKSYRDEFGLLHPELRCRHHPDFRFCRGQINFHQDKFKNLQAGFKVWPDKNDFHPDKTRSRDDESHLHEDEISSYDDEIKVHQEENDFREDANEVREDKSALDWHAQRI